MNAYANEISERILKRGYGFYGSYKDGKFCLNQTVNTTLIDQIRKKNTIWFYVGSVCINTIKTKEADDIASAMKLPPFSIKTKRETKCETLHNAMISNDIMFYYS
jgi:hypothetical protein